MYNAFLILGYGGNSEAIKYIIQQTALSPHYTPLPLLPLSLYIPSSLLSYRLSKPHKAIQ